MQRPWQATRVRDDSGCRLNVVRVRLEPYDFIAHPFVERQKLRLQRQDLIAPEHFGRLKAAGVARHDPQPLRRHAVCGQQIITCGIPDIEALVFGGRFRYRNQLDPVFLAMGRVVKEVTEIARPLRAFERGAHVVLILCRIRHVQDKAGVTAILVVATPKQRR